jgi:hypothetical protein
MMNLVYYFIYCILCPIAGGVLQAKYGMTIDEPETYLITFLAVCLFSGIYNISYKMDACYRRQKD